MKGRKIGGVAEILYPDSNLPEIIVQSLIFCIKNHLENKGSKEGSHFSSSELILLVTKNETDLKNIINSILSSKHKVNQNYFLSFNRDPKDIILGLIPSQDDPLYEVNIRL